MGVNVPHCVNCFFFLTTTQCLRLTVQLTDPVTGNTILTGNTLNPYQERSGQFGCGYIGKYWTQANGNTLPYVTPQYYPDPKQ